MKSFRSVLALFAALAVVAAPVAHAGKPAGKTGNIVQVAKGAGSFTTLLKAVEAADLTGALSGQGKGPLTVFAPTDEAFAKIPAADLQALLQNKQALRNVLLYHVAEGNLGASQVVSRSSLTMLNGQSVTINTSSGVKVNNATVVATDVAARNGVIHVIDTVLLPPQ
jgi:uncharacterized surface protein with fasciclin (FAS1) repeats